MQLTIYIAYSAICFLASWGAKELFAQDLSPSHFAAWAALYLAIMAREA